MRPDTHDPADAIAAVAAANWQRLLRVHHYRLSRPDLEDCLSQALLELLSAAERGHRFREPAATLTALDLRFQSRIIDRHRALAGRSPISAALHQARPLDSLTDTGPAAATGAPLALVLQREDLARLAYALRELTADQRLVLLAQAQGERPAWFCTHHGWSVAKYRKTLSRARARLRALLS